MELLTAPVTREGLFETARQFETEWNMPNCFGALFGYPIRKHKNSGKLYYNYKLFCYIVRMAAATHLYGLMLEVFAINRTLRSTTDQHSKHALLHAPN